MNGLVITYAQTGIILIEEYLLNFFLVKASAEYSKYGKRRDFENFNPLSISTDACEKAAIVADCKILHTTLRMSIKYLILNARTERSF